MRRPTRMRRRLGPVAVCLVAVMAFSATAFAGVVQEGNLRVSIATRLAPYKLPRTEPAPIKVFIAGHIFTADGVTPPQLQEMEVEINRHGQIDTEGLPICRLAQIKATAEQRLASLSAADRACVFGGTAAALYPRLAG